MGKKSKHEFYGVPKRDYTISLTEEAAELLNLRAKEEGLSRSELIERAARSVLYPKGLAKEEPL